MPLLLGAVLVFGISGGIAHAAQSQTGTIRVEVVVAATPIAGAAVSAGSQSATTNVSGLATLTLPAGSVSVTAIKDGYAPSTASVTVVAGSEIGVRLVLITESTAGDQAALTATTRAGLRIADQAVPIGTLRRDVIEENMLMMPGDIVGSLDRMTGLRMQTTSPELGLSMIRIQGMRGQHTRLLSDGVPLYFDIPGGLAPVQIPPMDLDRVEAIKGGASAFFGANALSGVVNLLSRKPGAEPEREILFSQSAPDATDAALFLSSPPTGSWSHTFLVSTHRQDEHDVDDDGWSDVPGYRRG